MVARTRRLERADARSALQRWGGATVRWMRGHVLHMNSLPRQARLVTMLGLVAAAIAAAAIVLVWLKEPQGGLGTTPQKDPLLLAIGATAALLAMGLGVALLGAASMMPGWPLPRATYLLAASMGLITATNGLLTLDGFSNLSTGATAVLVRWPLWVATLAVLVGLVRRFAFEPIHPGWHAAALASPFAAVACSASVQLLTTHDRFQALLTVFGAPLPLSFAALIAPAALLLWLAVEGLRVSRDVGVALLRRAPAKEWLVLVLLAIKLALLVLAWKAAVSALGPQSRPTLAAVVPSTSAYFLALPFAVATFWILSREERLGLLERSYAQGAVGLAVAFLSVLAPIVVYGLVVEGLLVSGNPLRLLGGMCVLTVAMVLWRSRRRWDWRRTIALCGGVTLLVSCLPLLTRLHWVGAGVTQMQAMVQRRFAALNAQGLRSWLLIAVLIAALAALIVVLTRPAFRPAGLFLLAVVLWGIPTLVLSNTKLALLGERLDLNPVAFDVVLSLCTALLLLAWWRGWQASVRPTELTLLLVVTTAVIYAPVVKAFLPAGWRNFFVPFALITPAVTQLTLDVAPLNANGAGRVRTILATIGAICLAFGLVVMLMMAAGRSYTVVNDLVDLSSGLSAIPFAVLLVAITSAALREEEEAKAAGP
jgi:hypothetical protein